MSVHYSYVNSDGKIVTVELENLPPEDDAWASYHHPLRVPRPARGEKGWLMRELASLPRYRITDTGRAALASRSW